MLRLAPWRMPNAAAAAAAWTKGAAGRSHSHSDSSAPPRSRPLAFALPDLAPYEEAYVRSQLDLLASLHQEHLAPMRLERASVLVSAEYPRLLSRDGWRMNDKYRGAVNVHKHIKKSEVMTRRTIAALKELGVTEEDILASPAWLKAELSQLPRAAHEKFILDCPYHEIHNRRRNDPVRGNVIHQFMDDFASTLVALEMISAEAAEVFERVKFFPANSGHLTLKDLDKRAIEAFIRISFPEHDRPEALKALNIDSDAGRAAPERNKGPGPVGPLAKNFVRNCWIFSQWAKLPQESLFTPAMLRKMAFRVCPLESLITINDFYETLSESDESLTPESFVRDFSSQQFAVRSLLYPSYKFPARLRMRLLREIGFDEGEAAQVLMSKQSFGDKGSPPLRYTSVQYVPTMRHRLKLLRENSEKLGLIGSTDVFAAMTHWGSVMASARKIVDGGQGSMCLHFLDSPKNRCILRAYPVQGKRHQHPALKLLWKYFDCQTKEDKKLLKDDALVSPAQKSVTLGQVSQTLDFLEKKGFTKQQLRRALPLLFYPATLVEEALKEARRHPEVGASSAGWEAERRREDFLCSCLYFVEKDFHFGSDGYLVGFRPALSEAFLAEVERETGPRRGGIASDAVQPRVPSMRGVEESRERTSSDYEVYSDEDEDDEDFFAPSPLRTAHPRRSGSIYHLNPTFPHQHQGMRQLHTSSHPPSQQGSGGTLLRNLAAVGKLSLRTMRVNMDFAKLKHQWDPDMDKDVFLQSAKEAVYVVTRLLRQRRYLDLEGLVSPGELRRLRREAETEWPEVLKNNVALSREGREVKLAAPVALRMQEIAGGRQRFCDVDVKIFAVKSAGEGRRRFAMAVDATFSRDYSEGRPPDWVITRFRVKGGMDGEFSL